MAFRPQLFGRSLVKSAEPTEFQRPGSNSSGKEPDNGVRTTAKMVASKIVGVVCSPANISGWIHDHPVRYRFFNQTLPVIDDASKASQIVSGAAYNWDTTTTPDSHTSLDLTLPLTASVAITPPSSGDLAGIFQKERKKLEDIAPEMGLTLFDTNRDGYLNTDDIETLMQVYGLEETTFPSDCTGDGKLSKEQFTTWLGINMINLFCVRYPFKLLRLVSYCFRHGSFSDPRQMTSFMGAIFIRTFGKKVKMEVGMFGHVGHFNYLHDSNKSSSLPIEDLETLLRMWGLTKEDTEAFVDEIRLSRIAAIPCLQVRHIFNDLQGGRFGASGVQRVPLQVSDFFVMLDRDRDGFLSRAEIARFAARFNHQLSEEQIDRVTESFDLDKDGYIGVEDFRQAMSPLLQGTSFEVWLVGIAFAFLLAANPALLCS